MKNSRPTFFKKGITVLLIFLALSAIPNSFADEIVQSITETIAETITETIADITPTQEVAEDLAPAPSEPLVEPDPSPAPSEIAKEQAEPSPSPSPSPTATDEPSPTASPSPTPTPKPPHAIENQNMRIIAPSEVNVDPRARSVFLPRIYIASPGNLLICASSNLGAFDANTPNISSGEVKSSLEISGANTPYLRISGVGSQAGAIINSGNGLRVFSNSRALAGTYIHLRFVALSEVSANPKLCGDGSASNTRTIYLRGLGIDLNITKSGITLK